MQPSLSFCRAQEERQRAIAREALLPNSRHIAMMAASAWAKEGLEAVKREALKQGRLAPQDAAIAAEFLAEQDNESEAEAT